MAKRPDKRDAGRTGSGAGGAAVPGGGVPSAPYAYRPYSPEELEADPELWWKERQRQMRASASWSPVVKTRKRDEKDVYPPGAGLTSALRAAGERTVGDLPAAGSAIRPDRYGAGTPSGTGGMPGGIPAGLPVVYGGGAPIAPWYGAPAGPGDGIRPTGPDHGIRPPGPDGGGRSMLFRLRQGFVARAAVALLLYGAAWGWLKADLPGSREAETWMTLAVTQDMDFSAAEAWYGRNFGDSPSFLPVFRHGMSEAEEVSAEWDGQETLAPVQGLVAETFKQNGSGIRIEAAAGSMVSAVHSGRVIQVTRSSQGDATILVQHAGRIVSVYGGVGDVAVGPDDWVEAGGKLGALGAATDGAGVRSLYFAIRLGDKPLDPQEVISFD
ncbi:M23 family metallopeptidase [Cohnella sp. JJ-181]|uniref:M23 family metallopeptidase n=1 Tax=Cohnella rhizoplanae TaxID=2974897 RepID=UPI0022FFB12F|nr:M23 family metallopeptidase [Cohnella sp. JJ-181]CAI6082370.1 hypothetical protein COHCIP112018_03621 [Cohnella sp. JJ-181]